jgi:hypothetical protein
LLLSGSRAGKDQTGRLAALEVPIRFQRPSWYGSSHSLIDQENLFVSGEPGALVCLN